MRVLLVIAVAVLHVACLGGGSRPRVAGATPSLSAAERELQGEWELVSLEAQGQPRQASGRLSFDQFNNIAVRAELSPGEAGAAPPRLVLVAFAAKATPRDGQIAYAGVERRAPAEEMLPTAAEPSAWRHYAIAGDSLRLWLESDGAPVGVMTFRRVR